MFQSQSYPPVSSMDGCYSCNVCGHTAASYGQLVEHKRSHVAERPFSCHICHKRFTQKAHLNIHKRTHTGEKPYGCPVCHKRFAQSSHLNSHRRIHAQDRPYFCSRCNTGFSQKHRFQAHLPCMHPSSAQATPTTSLSSTPMAPARMAVAGFGGGGANAGGGVEEEVGVSTGGGVNVRGGVSAVGGVCIGSGEGLGGEVEGIDGEMEVDRKPDVRYLGSLIQQLAEFSAPSLPDSSDLIPGVKVEVAEGLKNGEVDPSGLSSVGLIGQGSVSRDEPRTSVSAACMPALTSHRRKPAFIRHVDNDDSASCGRDRAVDTLTSTAPAADSMAADPLQDSHESRVTSFQNGFSSPGEKGVNGSVNGPLQANAALLPMRISPAGPSGGWGEASSANSLGCASSDGRGGGRITLANFTTEELLTHLSARPDVHRCDLCRLIFQDAAMYHIHRNMHDKRHLHRCNLCGKTMADRYDFTAHFLTEHR